VELQQIIAVHMRNVPVDESVDLQFLADHMQHFNGAHVKIALTDAYLASVNDMLRLQREHGKGELYFK